jgi:hypothetical protein
MGFSHLTVDSSYYSNASHRARKLPTHFCSKKVAEYLQNLEIAQQKATTINSSLPFSSFDNPIFNEQLRLYLSYIAAVGTQMF